MNSNELVLVLILLVLLLNLTTKQSSSSEEGLLPRGGPSNSRLTTLILRNRNVSGKGVTAGRVRQLKTNR
ncbi:MAG: hypothetical protein KME35_01130 [Aphanocapsa sp. GSE-SYN-MK-11-07L]|nr:hypothetical protein [Aphanocapsa sp. GSE-SYN-MK-11-07L]